MLRTPDSRGNSINAPQSKIRSGNNVTGSDHAIGGHQSEHCEIVPREVGVEERAPTSVGVTPSLDQPVATGEDACEDARDNGEIGGGADAADDGKPVGPDGKLRPGWTEEMVREFASMRFALHAMSICDGFAPSRREFVRVSGSGAWRFEKYFGSYEAFVRSGGYRLASERRMDAAARRRAAVWQGGKKGQIAHGKVQVSEAGSVLPSLSPALPPSLPPSLPPTPSLREGALNARRSKEIVYGDRIHCRGMAHAPVNEQGVVLLFGMLAAKLGFEIEMVRTGYPDCEAKRQGKDGKWRRVMIEFEFATSRFDHDPAGCDLIVCWEDDNNRSGLEVVELKRLVRGAGDVAVAAEAKE